MRSRLLKGVMMTTLVASLNGCGELPVVGDLGATLSVITEPVMGMLDPVIGQFLPQPEPTPRPRPTPRPGRRRVRPAAVANQPVQAVPGATDSPVVAAVQQSPQAAFAAWADRNRRFDKLRTFGLIQLYNGQTANAIQSFKEAQALRPEDPHIATLVAMAQNPSAFSKEEKASVGFGTPPSLPQPAAPGLPAGAAGAVNQLLNGAQGGQPPQGDEPGGLF